MFKETLESTQNSKYQRAHFRMMMREPEFLIPGNGKKYKKRCVGGVNTDDFFLFFGKLYLNPTQVCSCLQQGEIKYKWLNARDKIKRVLLG